MVVSRGLLVLALVAVAPVAEAGTRCSRCVIHVGDANLVVTGKLSPSLDVTVTAPRWPLGGLELRDVEISVRDVAGAYRGCASARVASARIHACGTLAKGGELVADVVVAARDMRVPIAVRANVFSGRVTSATARALGGELAIEPVALRWPLDVTLHVKGLALADLLPELVHGTGVVDGDLALRIDGDGLTIASAELHARSTGELAVSNTTWMPHASVVHERIAAMLRGFAYDRISATIAPRGRDPEAQLVLRGRDKVRGQELDLVIRLHGARDVAQRLLARVWRSS